MFRPGPSSTETSCAAASSPIASPTASPRAGSQLLATVAEVGKQVAGTLGFRPRWSAAPACLRTPLGPSDRVMDGMPLPGRARVSNTVPPLSSAHFCSRLRLLMISVFHRSLLTIKKRGRAFARRPFCSYVLIRRFLRPLSFCGSGGSSERPEPRSDRRRRHPLRR